MEPTGRALLLFTRSPFAEARAKGIAPEEGSRLFLELLSSWEDAARRAGVRLFIASPAPCRRWMEKSAIGKDAEFLTQEGDAFGERLQASAAEAMARGARELVVVGGDGPAVSSHELIEIFEVLARSPSACVLGPSEDGGVYLVGLTRRALPILGGMHLRRGDVFERSLEYLRQGGFEARVVARRGEIDSPADLETAWKQARLGTLWSPYRRLIGEIVRPALDFGAGPARSVPFVFLPRLPARAPPAGV